VQGWRRVVRGLALAREAVQVPVQAQQSGLALEQALEQALELELEQARELELELVQAAAGEQAQTRQVLEKVSA
jgi:predicted transcriptional regulator